MKELEEGDYGISQEQDIFQRYLGLGAKTFLFLVIFVILIGMYIGIILYGTNSVKVLWHLQSYESYLQEEIAHLKKENASLQKEYFELKEISGYTQKEQ